MFEYLLSIIEEKLSYRVKRALRDTFWLFVTAGSWMLTFGSLIACAVVALTAFFEGSALYLLWELPCLVLTFLGVFGINITEEIR